VGKRVYDVVVFSGENYFLKVKFTNVSQFYGLYLFERAKFRVTTVFKHFIANIMKSKQYEVCYNIFMSITIIGKMSKFHGLQELFESTMCFSAKLRIFVSSKIDKS